MNILRTKAVVRILAIESSCDDTGVAIVENGRKVLSNVLSSQVDIHTRFGGVVPEIASRNHILAILPLVQKALDDAKLGFGDIDAIGVTQGAGLVGSLLVGLTTAKALAYALDLPLIACNHIKGHICANYITYKDLKPPFGCLIVSGGHTAVVRVDDYTKMTLFGTTIDDAIGESFDKVARVVGLGYPGGPKIDKIAKGIKPELQFVHHSSLKDSPDFSFSGLKTAVINYVHNQTAKGNAIDVAQVCASFQHEAVSMVVQKTIQACIKNNLNTVCVAGGVSANSYLREMLTQEGQKHGIKVLFPKFEYCTDNAAMIGSLAYFMLKDGNCSPLNIPALPNIPLEQ
ncbi:MAG: tRNA (adenosine(37)-N6)-threonylcarbamoyltransferase complex transferase subunit TsaD [Clostridia bacterium]|nr:tRNA (adenosine(37)-N6)-threonylcarbamoyltransferase complex transferase subunit TsaD [Clostridia bacterium]